MKLIVGLGNPGEKYVNTRHNLGFMAVDRFLKDISPPKRTWQEEKKLKSLVTALDLTLKKGRSEKVLLVLPQTYMNNSGETVRLVASFFKIPPEDILIVHDDLDLPVGKLKIRFGGAAAGHHGVESVIQQLGTDKFWRFRLGIGNAEGHNLAGLGPDESGKKKTPAKRKINDAEDFVLGQFSTTDKGKIRTLLKTTSEALEMALEKGLEAAQNRFNTK